MIKRQKNFRSILVVLCSAAVLTFMIVHPAFSMQSPAPGSTLNSSTVTFTWNRPAGADDFDLIIGTTGAGSRDIRSSSVFNDTSMTVSGLPADGRTVYVRLWTWINDWQYQDYTYQAVNGTSETPAEDNPPEEPDDSQTTGSISWDQAMAFDANGDGHLYEEEFENIMRYYSPDMSSQEIFDLFDDMDRNNSGRVGDNEYTPVWYSINNGDSNDNAPEEPDDSQTTGSISWDQSMAFDANGDGHLYEEEFESIMRYYSPDMSSQEIFDLFDDMDRNNSGRVGDNEYTPVWYSINNGDSNDNAPEEPDDSAPSDNPSDSGTPPTSDPQGVNYNFYFGHLHEHTQFSDGDGTPEDMFMAGISRGLDFMAASDHGYSISSSEAYDTASVADQFYSPGTFTTFASVEVSDGDHIGVHDEDHSVFWIDDNYGHNYADIYDDMAAHGAVGVFHHPDRYGSDAFGGMSYNATGDQVMTMMEIANKGDIEDSHYYLWIDALDKGWHIAPAAGDDNHSADWGRDDIRTVILGEENNRESLVAAMAERRLYATDDSNLEIDFRINGNVMGSIVDNSGSATMTVLTRDGDGENIAIMELITSGGWLVASHTGSEDWTMQLDPSNPYYFIRITQDDGDRAVTAPIWLEHGGAPNNSNADPVNPTSLAGTYHTNGGVNTTGSNITASTPANSGDYEIVSLGSSSCGGGTDAPIDRLLMEDQGFRLVGVEGEFDRKVEVWIRENTGQDSVTITGDGYDVAWNILTLNYEDYSFDINSLEVEVSDTHFSGRDHTTAPLNAPGGNYFNVAAMFFDDSVEIDNANGGDIIHSEHSFGDGDGFVVLLYPDGTNLPDYVEGRCHDSGGAQMVTVSFSPSGYSNNSSGTNAGQTAGSISWDQAMAFDANGDGHLYEEEFENIMRYYSPDMSSQEISDLFDDMDSNNSGRVGDNEYAPVQYSNNNVDSNNDNADSNNNDYNPGEGDPIPAGMDENGNGIIDIHEERGSYDAPLGWMDPIVDVEFLTYENAWRDPQGFMDVSVPDAFEIDGNFTFRSRIQEALEFIKERDPDSYRMIYSYCGRFEQVSSGSGMWAFDEPPTYKLKESETDEFYWLVGILIHDPMHSAQTRNGAMYTEILGDNLERHANWIAARFFREIGMIDQAENWESLSGTHWR